MVSKLYKYIYRNINKFIKNFPKAHFNDFLKFIFISGKNLMYIFQTKVIFMVKINVLC